VPLAANLAVLPALSIAVFRHSEEVVLRLDTREAPGSNLGPDTGYVTESFRGYPQYIKANAGRAPTASFHVPSTSLLSNDAT
jgi:hypothetical protein